MPLISTSPLLAILKTFVVRFEATKISIKASFCCIINVIAVLFALITSRRSVVYTIVSSLVLSPRTIKLLLTVKSPLTNRSLLYL